MKKLKMNPKNHSTPHSKACKQIFGSCSDLGPGSAFLPHHTSWPLSASVPDRLFTCLLKHTDTLKMRICDSPHHPLQEFPQMQPSSALQPTLSTHGFLIQKAKVPEFGPQNTSVLNFEMWDSYLTGIQDYLQPLLPRSLPVTCLLPPEPP